MINLKESEETIILTNWGQQPLPEILVCLEASSPFSVFCVISSEMNSVNSLSFESPLIFLTGH